MHKTSSKKNKIKKGVKEDQKAQTMKRRSELRKKRGKKDRRKEGKWERKEGVAGSYHTHFKRQTRRSLKQ